MMSSLKKYLDWDITKVGLGYVCETIVRTEEKGLSCWVALGIWLFLTRSAVSR